MVKILLIAIASLAVKYAFFYSEFLEPLKAYPYFNNSQCDFDEVLEGFSWKKIMKSKHIELTKKIAQISNEEEKVFTAKELKTLKEKLNYNPKYYANDFNLLPNPIVIELLDLVHSKLGKIGIFWLFAVLELFTNILTAKSYRVSNKQVPRELTFLLLCFNPLAIISV